jgi:starvation-inducible DNA-binding protein
MDTKTVVNNLKAVLADSYSLFLKTQNYHWNVTGPNFISLHTIFEDQYNDLFKAIDVIAERIRALGDKAPGTYSAYSKLTKIKDGNENNDYKTMIKELSHDQLLIVDTLKIALLNAQKIADEATADIIIGRIAAHQKNAWMLNSSKS